MPDEIVPTTQSPVVRTPNVGRVGVPMRAAEPYRATDYSSSDSYMGFSSPYAGVTASDPWMQYRSTPVRGRHMFSLNAKGLIDSGEAIRVDKGLRGANLGLETAGYNSVQLTKILQFRAHLFNIKDSEQGKKLEAEGKLDAFMADEARKWGLAYSDDPNQKPSAEKLIEFLKLDSSVGTIESMRMRQMQLTDLYMRRIHDEEVAMEYNLKAIAASAVLAKSASNA